MQIATAKAEKCNGALLRRVLRLELGICSFGNGSQSVDAVLESFFEGCEVYGKEAGRNGISDCLTNGFGIQQVRNCGEESYHHGIQHHALSEILGNAGGRDAINPNLLINV